MRPPGRIRRKLAKRITFLSHSTLATRGLPRFTYEISCDPFDISAAQGYWRTNLTAECLPWDGLVDVRVTVFDAEGVARESWEDRFRVWSWDTMTQLCKAASLNLTRDYGWEVNPGRPPGYVGKVK